MKIDLGDDVKIEVEFRGQKYSMREPTVDEVDKLDEDGAAKMNVVDFLSKLGIPADIVRGMGVSKARALVDGMLALIAKKN